MSTNKSNESPIDRLPNAIRYPLIGAIPFTALAIVVLVIWAIAVWIPWQYSLSAMAIATVYTIFYTVGHSLENG